MSSRFREFMARHPIQIRLREEDAAPVSGAAPPAPGNPDSPTDKHHFDALKFQLDIDDADFDAGLEGGVQQLWPSKEFTKARWNMEVAGMIPAMVKKRPDGNYDVTFMLDVKKKAQPKSMFYPDQKGMVKNTFDGDQQAGGVHEILSAEELQGMMTPAFRAGGAPGGAGGPGGAPPPGGSPSPMGGPGGPPPMGGM
jgi:hypothetical protein